MSVRCNGTCAQKKATACPDAETLAAYHERTLILEELTKWKEHSRHCLRCQETLALLEETSAVGLDGWQENGVAQQGTLLAAVRPAASASSIEKNGPRAAATVHEEILTEPRLRRFSRATSWRWAVPAGALAAGLILFVAVRENRMSSLEGAKSQMAQNTPVPPAPPQTIEQLSKSANDTAVELTPPKTTPPTKALRDLQNSYNMERSIVNPQTPASRAPAKPRTSLPSLRSSEANEDKREPGSVDRTQREAQERAKQGQAALGGTGHGFGNAPLPAPGSPDAGAMAGDNAAAKKKAQDRTNQTDQALSASELAEATRGAGALSREPATAQATQTSSGQFSTTGQVLMQVAESNPHVIVAPKGTYAWRVGAAGLIEGSSDAGLNWKVQDSEVRTELTSGSAPSDKVCWVVGKAGTILLTKDSGKHWKQVNSPLTEDLGGVHALDANHASIWNIGNTKSLQTADGGRSWVPAANE